MKALFFIYILLLPFLAMAQEEARPITAKNAVYVELLGNGILYSLNYERIFYQQHSSKMAARIGISAIPSGYTAKVIRFGAVLPIELLGLIGRTNNYLEVGIGVTPNLMPFYELDQLQTFDRYRFNVLVPFRIGYRYQKPKGGFFFKAGYTPTLDFTKERVGKNLVLIYGGISVGKSF